MRPVERVCWVGLLISLSVALLLSSRVPLINHAHLPVALPENPLKFTCQSREKSNWIVNTPDTATLSISVPLQRLTKHCEDSLANLCNASSNTNWTHCNIRSVCCNSIVSAIFGKVAQFRCKTCIILQRSVCVSVCSSVRPSVCLSTRHWNRHI